MAAGSISQEQFAEFAINFLQISEKTNDNWKKKEIPDKQLYLYKKEVRSIHRHPVNKEKAEDLVCLEDEDDDCSVNVNSTSYLTYEYHIVYSQSYEVPVLYFNVYHQNGGLLSLDKVWSNIPDIYKDRLLQERWSFITQQEHPLIGRPFFMLHPCHTKDLLSQISTVEPINKCNYIISWLSAVGPVVGLHLPLSYGKIIQDVT